MIDTIKLEMIKYNTPDIKRIEHALKVHSYGNIEGIDYRILVEADFIVNIAEDRMDRKTVESVKRNIFRTGTGIDLLNKLYLY